jgi:hypothetical protein
MTIHTSETRAKKVANWLVNIHNGESMEPTMIIINIYMDEIQHIDAT